MQPPQDAVHQAETHQTSDVYVGGLPVQREGGGLVEIFEATREKIKNIKLLFNYLKTIPPTSVE